MAKDDAQQKVIDEAIKALEKEYGKGTVMKLGSKERVAIDVIPTGSIKLDDALGIGGWPKGRIVEIFGPEMSGKCLTKDAYIDSEFGLLTVEELFEKQGIVPASTTKTVESLVFNNPQ